MVVPFRFGQLVGNQQISRLGIGHTQKRLRKRKECGAFLRSETIFLQKLVHPPIGLHLAQIGQQGPRGAHNFGARGAINSGGDHQWGEHFWFRLAMEGPDGSSCGFE